MPALEQRRSASPAPAPAPHLPRTCPASSSSSSSRGVDVFGAVSEQESCELIPPLETKGWLQGAGQGGKCFCLLLKIGLPSRSYTGAGLGLTLSGVQYAKWGTHVMLIGSARLGSMLPCCYTSPLAPSPAVAVRVRWGRVGLRSTGAKCSLVPRSQQQSAACAAPRRIACIIIIIIIIIITD